MHRSLRVPLLAAVLAIAACGGPAPAPTAPASAPAAITNRIPLPPDVVANLGITFAQARRGRLESRLRVPGRVEVAPDARFTVRAPSAGRLVVASARWQRVTKGDVVAEVLSPDLRTAQEALAEAGAAAERLEIEILRTRAEVEPLEGVARAAQAALEAARARERDATQGLAEAEDLERAAHARVESTQRLAADAGLATGAVFAARKDHVEARSAALEAARRRDEARSAIAERALAGAVARARASTIGREVAVLERRKASVEASARQQLKALAALTGSSVESLAATAGDGPAWARLDGVPLRAPADGVVVEILASNGEWVEAGASLLRIVDPTQRIFRGEVPESDLARIPPGAPVRLEVGPEGGARLETRLSDARPLADPRTRTVLIEAPLPAGAAPSPDGASATASVLLGTSAAEETLLPVDCVVLDDLESVVFRRDPARPDEVIRVPVALGRRADGWVEVLSEVAEGDEVVADGVHQLRLTGAGKAPSKGHFHADGSWHEGED